MAPPGPRLVLCEEKIREKSGLAPHRDLAELRTLSIPGSYQEKLTHLGNALARLTGLRSLDLSRNSLVSLEGIQYLAALQSLNLYYNCISSPTELLWLHPLAQLANLDLRLNPVAKGEPDHRLFLLHLLPWLQRLDDRPVRESERRASQLHFASEAPPDAAQGSAAFLGVGRPQEPRAQCPDPAAGKCLVMDADDEAVLNLIAECEWGLSSPPGAARSSSSQKERGLGSQSSPEPSDAEDSLTSSQRPGPPAPQLLGAPPTPGRPQKRRVPGGRLRPAPDPDQRPACPELPDGHSSPGESLSRQTSSEGRSQSTFPPSEALESGEHSAPSRGSARQASPRLPVAPAPGRKAALELALLEALLDLVDRHWSGRKSLHGHEAFLAQARLILSSAEEFAGQDRAAAAAEEPSDLALENRALQERLAAQQQQHSAQLRGARREMGGLQQRLDQSLEENSTLRSLLCSLRKEVKSADTSAALNLQLTGLQASVQSLSGDVGELKQRLEHYDQVQELTRMLQESHSSLVSTNERLLQELGQARAQHRAEVEQLHWSYLQLKRTLTLAPPDPRPGRAGLAGCP